MIDITQELFTCQVYPGDTPPGFSRVSDLEKGDDCTVTDLVMCAHNGTHLDAPAHFIRGGKTIDQLPLSVLYGRCIVRTFAAVSASLRDLTLPEPARHFAGEEAEQTAARAQCPRLLIKGEFTLGEEEARLLARTYRLIGCEAQSIGSPSVHRILLGAEIAVLEGLVLSGVAEGEYTLCAFPMKLGGADGAPVRAVLLEEGEV